MTPAVLASSKAAPSSQPCKTNFQPVCVDSVLVVSIKAASRTANVPARGQLLGGLLCCAGRGRGHPQRLRFMEGLKTLLDFLKVLVLKQRSWGAHVEDVFALQAPFKKAYYNIDVFAAGFLEQFVQILLNCFMLFYLFSNLGWPRILGCSVNTCFHLSLLSASLGDSDGASTLHLGADRWWRMTSWWWGRQAFEMHWRRWCREPHSPV